MYDLTSDEKLTSCQTSIAEGAICFSQLFSNKWAHAYPKWSILARAKDRTCFLLYYQGVLYHFPLALSRRALPLFSCMITVCLTNFLLNDHARCALPLSSCIITVSFTTRPRNPRENSHVKEKGAQAVLIRRTFSYFSNFARIDVSSTLRQRQHKS